MARVLITEPLSEDGLAVLRQEPGVEVDVRLGLKPEELAGIIGAYEGLIVRSETKVTSALLDVATKMQVVGRAGSGVDNIDANAATRRGIVVVNAPEGNTIAAAEHTIGLMLALARHIPEAHGSLRGGKWARSTSASSRGTTSRPHRARHYDRYSRHAQRVANAMAPCQALAETCPCPPRYFPAGAWGW